MTTLLLTSVAFKFLVSDSLPKVPYATLLDRYLNTGFLFLASIMFENSVVANIDEEIRDRVDAGFAYICITFWVLFNLWYHTNNWIYLRRLSQKLGPPKQPSNWDDVHFGAWISSLSVNELGWCGS